MRMNVRFCAVVMALLLSAQSFGQAAFRTHSSSDANTACKRYHGDGIDNVLEYVPMVAVFGLKALGVESESSWKKRLTVSAASFAINAGVTYALKHTIHEKRPDGTDNRSFPSGHTSIVFCGATTLMHEYHKVSPWIGVAGYAVATTVAVDRVRRNRHRWSDVLAGAAIGCASAEFGYLISNLIHGKDKKGEDGKDKTNENLSFAVSPMGVNIIINLSSG